MTHQALFDALINLYPNPTCELVYINDFTLLVAIILSAQSTDKRVNIITKPLFERACTPQAMIDLGDNALKEYIKSINYFNNKTKSIMALSHQLVDKYNSTVPHDMDILMTLPGVGRKTASVFLNVADKAPIIGVDTHVFRLCHRLNICTGKTPDEIAKKLEKIIPESYKTDMALCLVHHGRYVCTAKRPKCDACALYNMCSSTDKKEIK